MNQPEWQRNEVPGLCYAWKHDRYPGAGWHPVVKLSGVIVLDANVETVWSALVDDRRRPRWQTEVIAVEPLSGTPGIVGATSRLVFDEQCNRSAIASLTEARRPDFAAFAIEEERSSSLVVHALGQIDERHTRWEVWTNTRFHGLAKVTAVFRSATLREILDYDMQRFKLMVETDEAGTPP